MFETKERLQAIHDLLMNKWGRACNRGDTVSLAEIEEAIGVKRYRESWMWIINRFKKSVMQERGIALWCMELGSLKFLGHSEQVKHMDKVRHKRVWRQTSRLKAELEAVEPDQLGDNLRRYRLAALERLRSERRVLRQSRNVIKRTETNPVRTR